MQVYLNCSETVEFGDLLTRFEEIGFRGARIDVRSREDTERSLAELAQWVEKRPISRHIYILHGVSRIELIEGAEWLAEKATDLGVGEHIMIEMFNEPDLDPVWGKHPEELGRIVGEVWRWMRRPEVKLLSPSVSNVGPKQLKYARRMLKEIPVEVGFAFHRYIDRDLSAPDPAYTTRAEELRAILDVVGGRELHLTETGQTYVWYKPKPYPFCFRKDRVDVGEDEVAQQIVADLEVWHAAAVLSSITYYQINDGPPNVVGPQWGWRHYEEAWDGLWKAVAGVMPPVIRSVDTEVV